ncbi:hypothetical protein KEM55_005720, partial [Ascosphaera atra]
TAARESPKDSWTPFSFSRRSRRRPRGRLHIYDADVLSESDVEGSWPWKRRGTIRFSLPLLILVALLLGLSVTSTFTVFRLRQQLREQAGLVPIRRPGLGGTWSSPAQVAERWERVRFDGSLNTRNKYFVSKEEEGDEKAWRRADAAWSQLYDNDPITVSTAELQNVNETSVEVPSRPGEHLVKLAVFHQLHCLDMVRKWVHRERYIMDSSRSSISVIHHVDHCIDILRQAITCHADTTLITFAFDWTHQEPVKPNFNVVHACKNFDELRRWNKARQVNLMGEIRNNPDAWLRFLGKTNKDGSKVTGEEGQH